MKEIRAKYNPAYSGYFETDARHALLWGGRGSGKTMAAVQKTIMQCLRYPGFRHLTLRKVLKSCRHSTFQAYRDELTRLGIPHKVNRVEMGITFPNGSEILHAGLDDPMKLLSITGIDSIHTEEADQITEDEFEEADVLMRGDPTAGHFQHTLTFNPRRGKFWARRRFVDAPDHAGAFVLHTTWKHNLFLDSSYGQRLAAIPDANKRAIYEMGEWGQDIRGLIYPAYGKVDVPLDPPDAYGLDLGFVHPTALVAVWERDPQLIWRQVIYASGMTTPRLIAAMKEEGVDRYIPVWCPPEQPAVISELVDAGFDARPANNKVEDGIATVQRYQLCLTKDSPDLMDEADEYKWEEDRDGRLKDKKPVKINDDGMDAGRYGTHSQFGIAEPEWGMW